MEEVVISLRQYPGVWLELPETNEPDGAQFESRPVHWQSCL
jgi:uncharacterized protein YqhQ